MARVTHARSSDCPQLRSECVTGGDGHTPPSPPFFPIKQVLFQMERVTRWQVKQATLDQKVRLRMQLLRLMRDL